MPCDPLSVFLLWFEASFSRNLLVLFKGNSLSTHKKSLSSLLTPPNFKVPYQPMFLFIVPYLPLSHFPSNVVSIIWSRCINLDNFTPSLISICVSTASRGSCESGSAAWERARVGMEGSVGAGALAWERECCAGGGYVRTGLAREALAGGGACGLAAHEAHPAKALHLGVPAPHDANPAATAELHLPPCTARGRHSHLPRACSTSAAQHRDTVTSRPVHACGAAPIEASDIHTLHRRGTTHSCRRSHG
jgi:hypothetical protein